MDSSGACKFFQTPRGCLRGDSCTFRHDKPAGSDPSQASPWGAPGAPSLAMAAGGAVDGSGGVDLAQGITTYSPGNPYASGAAPPCRFFLTESGCRNGVSCPFAHVGAPLASYAAPPQLSLGYGALDGATYAMDMALLPPPLPPLQTMDASAGYALDATHATPTSNASTPTAGYDYHGSGGGGGGAELDAANGKPRRKLNIPANPSKKANYEVISEISPVLTRDIEGPFIAIDVECVATGPGVDDRDVARIAVVDENENIVYDRHVMPDKPILSYLTQLTGISESDLVGAPSLAEAMVELRALLPRESVIVGQSIKKDLEWLGLEKEADYKQAFDVADLFRIPMQSKNGTIRYRFFSLRHVAKYLLGHDIQEADHDPVIDAKYAMKIFKQFRHLHESPGRRDAVYQTLLQTPRTPSFAERYPVIDGVLMRAPRKPREHHQHHHHHNYRGHHNPTSMPPPTYAPDPTLMT